MSIRLLTFILVTQHHWICRWVKFSQDRIQKLRIFHVSVANFTRWTPASESPGSRRSGARYMKLLTGMARLVGAAAVS